MNEPTPDKPKIIVDEDWKSQVQAEKEAAEKPEPDSSQPPRPQAEMPIPEASFSLLVTTLATQAMVALGQVPLPEDEQIPVNLDFAKHCIDTLDVLAEKTKGNLTPEEANLLERLLHESRMLFIHVRSEQRAASADKQP